MYIRRVHIKNLKRLREFDLSFTQGVDPRMWTVFIGENGTAKTTLLQAIALAAAGSKQVNTLAAPVVKYLRDRRTTARMEIDAWFDFTPLARRTPGIHPPEVDVQDLGLRSSVSLEPGSTSLDANAEYINSSALPAKRFGGSAKPRKSRADGDPLNGARDIHTPLWFVAGYGISRLLPDPAKTPPLDRPSIERMLPLFDPDARLASTSFANHFLKKDIDEGRRRGTTSRMYGAMLNEAIKLGGAELLPDVTRLELRGQGGTATAGDLIESDRFHQQMGRSVQKIPGVALSHGYQSTFAWIADLIGQVLLESKTKLRTTEMEGLVLLDEIDLYLHPKWQSTFVSGLKRVFPRMQFVATTHSPVVLAGLAPNEIVRLMTDPNSGDVLRAAWDPETGELVPATAHEAPQPDPRPMTGSELYRTWFDLDRLTPNPHGSDLRRYLVLAGDPLRSAAEHAELTRLDKLLRRAGFANRPAPVKRETAR